MSGRLAHPSGPSISFFFLISLPHCHPTVCLFFSLSYLDCVLWLLSFWIRTVTDRYIKKKEKKNVKQCHTLAFSLSCASVKVKLINKKVERSCRRKQSPCNCVWIWKRNKKRKRMKANRRLLFLSIDCYLHTKLYISNNGFIFCFTKFYSKFLNYKIICTIYRPLYNFYN